jgi:hypothetical protein
MKKQIIISLIGFGLASSVMAAVATNPTVQSTPYAQTQQQAYQNMVQQYQQTQSSYINANTFNPANYNLNVQPANNQNSGVQPYTPTGS